MKLPPFMLDHWLAAHEFADPPIRYNLASSTGPQWILSELLGLVDGDAALREIAGLKLSYVPPQGSLSLRERIAAREGVPVESVAIMTGASEALQALICHFAPGPSATPASIVVPRPCYPAVPALARAWGLAVREYALDPPSFLQTADGVLEAVDTTTRAVFVNTPHNPTGSIMNAAEQRRLAEALAERGIVLIVDEVYHPLYFSGDVAGAAALPNTIVLGDFAKAMSLPGLRIGWLIDRDARRREALVDARSYFTISGSPLTEAIGAFAMTHADAILGKLRDIVRANLALLDAFMARHRGRIEYTRPAGGTTCFPRLCDGADARPLCEALAKAGVLVAPGDCFGMPAHMRIGFGAQHAGYSDALGIFDDVLTKS